MYQTSLVEGEWGGGVGGRLGDGLKRNDEGRSDCIDYVNCPGLSDMRCLMGFNCRIAIRGKIACY